MRRVAGYMASMSSRVRGAFCAGSAPVSSGRTRRASSTTLRTT